MTAKKKQMKQVSLDFKRLSVESTSRLDFLDREASLQTERDVDEEDCQIVSIDKADETDSSNRKINQFFKSSNPMADKVMKDCEVSVNRLADESMNSESIDSDEDARELSSSESEREEAGDTLEESIEESIEESVEEKEMVKSEDKTGDETAETATQESNTTKKKRRTSSEVQAERKRKELDKARRKMEREAARLRRIKEEEKRKEDLKKKKEQVAAEREAVKRQVEKEKEEKRIKREEAKKERERLKEEERLKKEDERQKKEEERRKREEEKQEKLEKLELAKKEKDEAKKQEEEELQRKKEKQAMFFNSFFIKSKTSPTVQEKSKESEATVNPPKETPFGVFQIKKGMRLATKSQSSETSKRVAKSLDEFISGKTRAKTKDQLYISEIRSGRRKGQTKEATWPMEKNQNDDVQCLGSIGTMKPTAELRWYRAKLLQFCENTRPAFYGTFRRRSRIISGKKPFEKDEKLLDYEIDSDDEWEDGDPGESLSHSENEDEDGEEDADEENDGFFVPHGYLSEDEGADDDEERMTPEMRKLQQQLSEARFEASMKVKIQPLVNVVIPPSVDASDHPLLASFKVIELIESFPIPVSTIAQTPSLSRSGSKNAVPDEAISDLVRLVHRNKLRMRKLLFEFRMFWEHKMTERLPTVTYEEDLKGRDWKEFSISKTQLEKRIKEIAKFDADDACWTVGPETLALHPADDVNSWNYVTNVREIVRKKRASSPKSAPSGSPEKGTDKEAGTDKPAADDKKTPKAVADAKESQKTPPSVAKALKEFKTKLLEERKKPKTTKMTKTEDVQETSSPKPAASNDEKKKIDKMSPKAASKREAMQKLKAELLKEKNKVFDESTPETGTNKEEKPKGETTVDLTEASPKVAKKWRARPSTPFSNPKVSKKKVIAKKEPIKEGNPDEDGGEKKEETKVKPKTKRTKKTNEPAPSTDVAQSKPKTNTKKNTKATDGGSTDPEAPKPKPRAQKKKTDPKDATSEQAKPKPKTQKRRLSANEESGKPKPKKPKQMANAVADADEEKAKEVNSTGDSEETVKSDNAELRLGDSQESKTKEDSGKTNSESKKPPEEEMCSKVTSSGKFSVLLPVQWNGVKEKTKDPPMEPIDENQSETPKETRKSKSGEKEINSAKKVRPLKRLSVDESKPMKLKLPTKKLRVDKENSDDDCEIIDLIDT